MPKFEHGFKSWCERQAKTTRADLGLGPTDPLNVFDLAKSLGVIVKTPNDVSDLPGHDLEQLLVFDLDSWSAVALSMLGQKVIIHNPTHSAGRQASNVAHELAHLILGHEGAREVVSTEVEFLLRSYDPQQEAEADWLGWTLLLPRDALLERMRAGETEEQIASRFGVSVTLAKYRINMTGVRRQLLPKRRSR